MAADALPAEWWRSASALRRWQFRAARFDARGAIGRPETARYVPSTWQVSLSREPGCGRDHVVDQREQHARRLNTNTPEPRSDSGRCWMWLKKHHVQHLRAHRSDNPEVLIMRFKVGYIGGMSERMKTTVLIVADDHRRRRYPSDSYTKCRAWSVGCIWYGIWHDTRTHFVTGFHFSRSWHAVCERVWGCPSFTPKRKICENNSGRRYSNWGDRRPCTRENGRFRLAHV